MRASANALSLRLVPDDSGATPMGIVLARATAGDILQKLHARLSHYASLRVLATSSFLVLLSPERRILPWSAEVRFHLQQRGPAILPIGQRLDVPARWHDDVVRRLAGERNQSLPLLILPDAAHGLQIAGLDRAHVLADIDLLVLAGACVA
ncbi:MAG: hypothetical protein FWD68_19335 [Alphaproteobacteria bacterium]|nr:hypothetical protein [Alphaproteobacteria bacterium]